MNGVSNLGYVTYAAKTFDHQWEPYMPIYTSSNLPLLVYQTGQRDNKRSVVRNCEFFMDYGKKERRKIARFCRGDEDVKGCKICKIGENFYEMPT